jgi:hypothetical protein
MSAREKQIANSLQQDGALIKDNVTYMVFYPPVLLGGMIKSYITL